MRTVLKTGQTAIGSFHVTLPKGRSLEIDVHTQKDGGVYVTQYLARKKGGVLGGETCFYCNGVLIGCITCGRGEATVGNCITKKVSCEPLVSNPTATTKKKK